MPDQEKFTGIWIPKEVWKDKKLSFMQRGLLAELFHLQDPERGGWAYPGNKYLGDIFGVSPNWISKNISDLVKLNYVTTKQTDRGRFVRVLQYGGSTIQWVGQSELVNPPMGIGQSATPPLVNPPTGEYIESIEIKTSAPTESIRSVPKPISYDFTTGLFHGVTDQLVATWQDMCPAINVEREILKAAQWLIANPTKRKKNYRKFLVNWMLRGQERGKG